jgi:hypothetical protein
VALPSITSIGIQPMIVAFGLPAILPQLMFVLFHGVAVLSEPALVGPHLLQVLHRLLLVAGDEIVFQRLTIGAELLSIASQLLPLGVDRLVIAFQRLTVLSQVLSVLFHLRTERRLRCRAAPEAAGAGRAAQPLGAQSRGAAGLRELFHCGRTEAFTSCAGTGTAGRSAAAVMMMFLTPAGRRRSAPLRSTTAAGRGAAVAATVMAPTAMMSASAPAASGCGSTAVMTGEDNGRKSNQHGGSQRSQTTFHGAAPFVVRPDDSEENPTSK